MRTILFLGALCLCLILEAVQGFAAPAAPDEHLPGTAVDMPYLIAPMTVDGKLVSYAYVSSSHRCRIAFRGHRCAGKNGVHPGRLRPRRQSHSNRQWWRSAPGRHQHVDKAPFCRCQTNRGRGQSEQSPAHQGSDVPASPRPEKLNSKPNCPPGGAAFRRHSNIATELGFWHGPAPLPSSFQESAGEGALDWPGAPRPSRPALGTRT